MVGSHRTGYPVDLECGHRLWFPQSRLRPSRRELVWCRHCDAMCLQMAAAISEGKVTWPEGWTSECVGSNVVGYCDYPECGTTYTQPSFRQVEQLMFQHHAIDHGKSSLLVRNPPFKKPDYSSGKAPF